MLDHTRAADAGESHGLMIRDAGGFRDFVEQPIDENVEAMSASVDALAFGDRLNGSSALHIRASSKGCKQQDAKDGDKQGQW
jgi:hypothetical protein